MPWLKSMQVPLQHRITGPRVLHQLIVVVNVVYAREDLFKIAQSELFLFKLQNDGQVLVIDFVKGISIFVHNFYELRKIAIRVLLDQL